MVAAWLNSADDHVETQVVIWPTVLIQTRFKVRRRRVIGKINSAPFNIEYAVWRCARYRREDTACSTRETGAASQTNVRAHVLPHRENGVVIRPNIGRRGQTACNEAAGLIRCHEVEASIGTDVYAREGLVI
jgi:hypothetical protein